MEALTQSAVECIINEEAIPSEVLEYFRSQLQEQVQDSIDAAFYACKAFGKDIEQIFEKLDWPPERAGAFVEIPRNLDLITLSDMALALGLQVNVTLDSISLP